MTFRTDTKGKATEDQEMVIPFHTSHTVTGQRRLPAPDITIGSRMSWSDGSYLVGILDGNLVGATALSNGLCIVNLADAIEVLGLLREHMPKDVRALVRKELLKTDW